MMIIQNPLVWLARVRHRRGYGVHSPFAFDFITNVLYNKERYYAYSMLDRNLRWWQKARVRNVRRLLLRLANFHQPKTLLFLCRDNALFEACHYGVRGLTLLCFDDLTTADMIVLDREEEKAFSYIAEGTMVVVLNLRRNRTFWKKIKADERVRVTFDMYDIGVAIARGELNKQDYVVNW